MRASRSSLIVSSLRSWIVRGSCLGAGSRQIKKISGALPSAAPASAAQTTDRGREIMQLLRKAAVPSGPAGRASRGPLRSGLPIRGHVRSSGSRLPIRLPARRSGLPAPTFRPAAPIRRARPAACSSGTLFAGTSRFKIRQPRRGQSLRRPTRCAGSGNPRRFGAWLGRASPSPGARSCPGRALPAQPAAPVHSARRLRDAP